MKRFNVTGNCVPAEDYMVNISGKISQIKQIIDSGFYFTLNQAKQSGKTTILAVLKEILKNKYTIILINFGQMDASCFDSDEKFYLEFVKKAIDSLKLSSCDREYIIDWENYSSDKYNSLSNHISKMCRSRKVVLIVDDADINSNNRVFLNFLGMLRQKYMDKRNGKDYTFHSVVFASVKDIKNIELPVQTYHAPFNIAADCNIDMSFSPAEISTMLHEYEADHNSEMDITAISEEIYNYTNGHPFLVSKICQHIDEDPNRNWSLNGVHEAVKILIEERNTLFDDLFKNLNDNEDLYDFIYDILIRGVKRTFNIDNPILALALMYGIIKKGNPYVSISNKIFELKICDYFSRRERG